MKRKNTKTTFVLSLTATIAFAAMLTGGSKDATAASIPFSETELYFELNHTDSDLGIHSSLDGGAWKLLEIKNPSGQVLLDVLPEGTLAEQGMTQLFFESAEPAFDELPPADFFPRFPEGRYDISGITIDDETMAGSAILSHVLPAPPGNVRVNGIPAAENCDADLPAVQNPVVITWNRVTSSHPTVGKTGPVRVLKYQVFAELQTAPFSKFSLDLPASVRRFVVPAELTSQGRKIKFEIQVRATNLNQTAIESCFTIQ